MIFAEKACFFPGISLSFLVFKHKIRTQGNPSCKFFFETFSTFPHFFFGIYIILDLNKTFLRFSSSSTVSITQTSSFSMSSSFVGISSLNPVMSSHLPVMATELRPELKSIPEDFYNFFFINLETRNFELKLVISAFSST